MRLRYALAVETVPLVALLVSTDAGIAQNRCADGEARNRRRLVETPRARQELHPGVHRHQPDRRRGDAHRAQGQGRPLRGPGLARQGRQPADAEGHDLHADVDDQADRVHGLDDAVGRRQVHARRPDLEVPALVQEPDGARERATGEAGAPGHRPPHPHAYLGAWFDAAEAGGRNGRHAGGVGASTAGRTPHEPGRDGRARCAVPAAFPPGRSLGVRRLDRLRGRPGREDLRSVDRRFPPHADFRAARDARHALQRPAGKGEQDLRRLPAARERQD